MSNPILDYQESKRQLVLRVTEADLIPDHLALTERDLTPENIALIKENFSPLIGLGMNNCLHCSIYDIGKPYEDKCKGCSYVMCSMSTLWGTASAIWNLRATTEDRDELYALGENLRRELDYE